MSDIGSDQSDPDPYGVMDLGIDVAHTPNTPPNNPAISLPQDTPFGKNGSVSSTLLHGSLPEQREAVKEYIGGAVAEVDFDFMLQYILPPSTIDVERSINSLEESGDLVDDNWAAFKGEEPVKFKSEKRAFDIFQLVNLAIVQNCRFRRAGETDTAPSQTLIFGTYPNHAPASTNAVKTRPDGCGILRRDHAINTFQYIPPTTLGGKPRPGYHWFDIAYTAEYKLADIRDSRNDNKSKILWSMHHIMHTDHRRRFTFGLTVENTSTRIWFCCRQIVLVSKPFNFMKEPRKLVQVIASLHYASSISLGYDPTVSHIWSDLDRLQYEILVHEKGPEGEITDKTFVTTGIISDESANILSRATRVYEAYDKSDPTQTRVVLKDSWIDVNRQLEGKTLSDILEGATDEEKSYFLTILRHGTVHIDGKEDVTSQMLSGYRIVIPGNSSNNPETTGPIQEARLLPLAEQAPAQYDTMSPDHISLHQMKLTNTSVLPSTGLNTDHPEIYLSVVRVHYRLIFKENGISLHHLAHQGAITLQSILMPAFCDIIRGLRVMSKKGYIHRDVTIANIVMHKGRAKLVDLEFAKKYGTSTSSPIRTGSHSFLATELLISRYCFDSLLPGAPRPVPRHNPLHDLESLWWIGIWFSFCFVSPSELNTLGNDKRSTDMRARNRALFPPFFPKINSYQSDEREALFTTEGLEQPYILHAKTLPKALRQFFALLERFRAVLITHYKKAEVQVPIDPAYFKAPMDLIDSLYVDAGEIFATAKLLRREPSAKDLRLVLLNLDNLESDVHPM